MATKMKASGKIFCFAIFLLIFVFNSKGFTEEISLSSSQVIPIFLEPSNSGAEIPFDIDTSPSFLVDVASPSDLFDVTITTPNGQIITPDNVANFNAEYVSHELQTSASLEMVNPTFLGGFHYTYYIQNPISGNWKVKITGSNLPADGEVALVNIIMQNSLKVGIITNKIQYIINSPVLIMATVFDGSKPVTGASVVATVLNLTTEVKEAVDLKDDGNEADNLAGDGLYSGVYIPVDPGNYAIMVNLSGVTNSGTPFNKDVFSSFSVRSSLADFNGSFNDQGIDTNGNDLYEYITLNLGLDVNTSGTYKVCVTLKGSNDISKTVNAIQELIQGTNQFITVKFFKGDIFEIGIDGPYSVTEAFIELLEDTEWYLADKVENQWQTQAYSLHDFEKGAITFTGNNSDIVIDTDNNGKFDSLVVSIVVEVFQSGTYQWSSRLVDKNNNEIEFISGSTFMNAGNNTITMTFDGQKIGENGVDGPYYVRNLLIWSESNSLIVNEVHTTQPYSYLDFEGANQPPIANAGPDQTVEQIFYQGADVTLDGSGSYDSDADPLTYTWTWAGGSTTGVTPTITLLLGITTVTLTVDDGLAIDSDEVIITIEDTIPPIVDAGPDITVEQAARAGTEVTLNGSASDICDASLDYEWIEGGIIIENALTVTKVFNLGTHTLTLKATDDSGNVGTDTVVVNVIDTALPELSVASSITTLWPPNHKYVTVNIDYAVSDICDAEPEVTLISVTSDELENENGDGDGNTLNDIVIVDNTTIQLRAERQGSGDGRVYTINYSATDASGNTTTASAIVTVPHDQADEEVVDSGVQYIVTP